MRVRKILSNVGKAAYVAGNITSALASFVLPNPIAASQLLCGTLSVLVTDKKLGKVAKIANFLGQNVGKASNDIDRNYHNYRY